MTHKTSSRPIPQPPDLTHMFIYAWKMEEISFFYYFDLLLMKIPKLYQHN